MRVCGIDASVRDRCECVRRKRAGSTQVREIDAKVRDRRERTGSMRVCTVRVRGIDASARDGCKCAGSYASVQDRCVEQGHTSFCSTGAGGLFSTRFQ